MISPVAQTKRIPVDGSLSNGGARRQVAFSSGVSVQERSKESDDWKPAMVQYMNHHINVRLFLPHINTYVEN